MRTTDQLIDDLNAAALAAGRGQRRGATGQEVLIAAEAAAAFALQDRFTAIRVAAVRLGDPELLALAADGQQA